MTRFSGAGANGSISTTHAADPRRGEPDALRTNDAGDASTNPDAPETDCGSVADNALGPQEG